MLITEKTGDFGQPLPQNVPVMKAEKLVRTLSTFYDRKDPSFEFGSSRKANTVATIEGVDMDDQLIGPGARTNPLCRRHGAEKIEKGGPVSSR